MSNYSIPYNCKDINEKVNSFIIASPSGEYESVHLPEYGVG